MNNIILEKEVFEDIQKRVKILKQLSESMKQKYGKKDLHSWLSSEEVCHMLNIKSRTLQTYRETGKLGFSQIGRKIFYRGSDVDKLLKENYYSKIQNLTV